MAQIIDTRGAGGEFVILGDSLTLPSSSNPVTPSQGSIRFNPVTNAVELYVPSMSGWTTLSSGGGASSGMFVPTVGNTTITGNITVAGTLTVVGNIVGDYFTGTSEYAINVGSGPGGGGGGGGGPGSFGGGSNGTSSSSDVSFDTVVADGTITERDLGTRFGEVLNLKDFGAAGDGSTDDTMAISQWWTTIINSTLPGFVPAGIYVVSAPLVWDMMSRNTGVTIIGAGNYSSIFNLNAVVASPNVSFFSSSNPTAYNKIIGVGFVGNIAGTILQIGQSNFSDPMDFCEFDFSIMNGSGGNGAIGLAVNLVRASTLNIAADAGSNGEAVRLNALAYSDVFGSFSNANIGIHITNGATYGNTFRAISCLDDGTCVVIDSSTANNNTFIGGNFQWTQYAINASAGNNNIFLNTNFSNSAGSIIASGVGVTTTDTAISLGYSPLNTSGGTMFGGILMANNQPIVFQNTSGSDNWEFLLDNTNTLSFNMDDGAGNSQNIFSIAQGSNTALNFNVGINGNASSATKFANAITLNLTGDVLGSLSFDGSIANIALNTMLDTPTNAVATYIQVSVDAGGRVVTGNSTPFTLEGAITGSGYQVIYTYLANSGVVPGTYFLVSVDATGRVIQGQNPGVSIVNDALAFSTPIIFSNVASQIGLFFEDSVDNPNTGLSFTNDVLSLNASDGIGGYRTIFSIAANSLNSVLMLDTNVQCAGFITGVISEANKWTSPITLSISGDAMGSVSVDGSASENINLTLANTGVLAGTYSQIVVDQKGRVINGSNAINAISLNIGSFNSLEILGSLTGEPVEINTIGGDPEVTLNVNTTGDFTWNGNTVATVSYVENSIISLENYLENYVNQQIIYYEPTPYVSYVANLVSNVAIGSTGYALDGRKPQEYNANTVGSGVPIFYGYADAANAALNIAVWLSTIDAYPVQD